MAVRFHNAGASSQTRFANFMLPLDRADALGEVIALSSGGNAYRQWDDTRDAIYTTTATWASGATSLTLSAGTPDAGLYFDLHSSLGVSNCGEVTSWDSGLVPLVYMVNGQTRTLLNPGMRGSTPVLRIDGNRMKQAVWEMHLNGWHITNVITAYHNQALAEFSTNVVWSDEQFSTGWSIPCEKLELEFGASVKNKYSDEAWTASSSNQKLTLLFTFTNGTRTEDRANWANRMYHGRRIAARGWLNASAVAGDVTAFTNATHLAGVANADEWNANGWTTGFLFGGKVGPVPQSPTAIIRPDYGQANAHYVTWNRGAGYANDLTTETEGLVFNILFSSGGNNGALGYASGSQVIHGYQELYDFECCIVDWALRPRWIFRDGTYPQPATSRPRFTLQNLYPSQYDDLNFGRPTSMRNFFSPTRTGVNEGMDNEHLVNGPLVAYYQMAKWDHFAYQLVVDLANAMNVNQRRGQLNSNGSSMSGDREPGRMLIAAIQLGAVCPPIRGMVMDMVANPVSSYSEACKRNFYFRVNAGNFTGPVRWSRLYANMPNFNGFEHAVSVVWHSHQLVGLAMLYLLTGRSDDLEMLETVGSNLFIHGTMRTNGHPTYTAFQDNLQLAYEMRASADGVEVPHEWRNYPHPNFDDTFNIPGYQVSIGSDILREWALCGAVCYAGIGQDVVAKENARQVRNTLCRDKVTTEPSTTPIGWMSSAWYASGDLASALAIRQARGYFGW